MTSDLTNELPPYQGVDICLGIGNDLKIPPMRGWVISEAGYYDRPQVFPNGKAVIMTTSPDEATELFCYALQYSKYPNCVEVKPCWVHSQQRVFGEISDRQFWTIR